MIGDRPAAGDDRAVAAHVSHVLAMGIVSLLVVGLLYGASAQLAAQQERTAERGLETVGNNLATELTLLDRMQTGGRTATLSVTHPDRIAGSTYGVTIADGSECDEPTIPTDTCLVLSTTTPAVTVRVPLRNDSELHVDRGPQGRFELDAVGGGSGETADPTRPIGAVESSLRLGVGANIQAPTFGETAGSDTNVPPVATFRTDPEYPSVGSSGVTFTADAEDPDGDDDDLVYEWDFDGDGTTDASGESATASPGTYYPDPGVYEPELTVTDENGNGKSTNVTRNLTVSGLVYAGDLTEITGTWGTYSGIQFSMENRWPGEDVEVTSVFVNQTSNTGSQPERKLDDLDPCFGDDPEVVIDGDTTDSYTRDTVCDSDVPYRWTEYGLAVPVDDRSDYPAEVLANGGTVEITIRGYAPGETVAGQDVRVVVQHTVAGQTNATSFEVSGVPASP